MEVPAFGRTVFALSIEVKAALKRGLSIAFTSLLPSRRVHVRMPLATLLKDAILHWSTPITDHGEFAGIRVPVKGEVVWHYETGPVPIHSPAGDRHRVQPVRALLVTTARQGEQRRGRLRLWLTREHDGDDDADEGEAPTIHATCVLFRLPLL